MSISKNGIPLTSLSDWEDLAGPKSPTHWADDRSAKEAARAWLEGAPEVQSLLSEHPTFGPVLEWHAEPEARLPFDDFAGEPRNSDLVVYAKDSHGPYIIAVEAKADEPFGETVADAMTNALERYLANNRSNGLKRIEQLAQALLGPRQAQDRPLKDIRYQLLTASAGALCEAERRGCNRALLLIHEFVTNRTCDENHARNAADLNAFATRVSHGSTASVGVDSIRGPFELPPATLFRKSAALYLAKVSRCLRHSSRLADPSVTNR